MRRSPPGLEGSTGRNILAILEVALFGEPRLRMFTREFSWYAFTK